MVVISQCVGDRFEIPLKDGRLAYCRLLHRGELGFLVQVFDLFRTTSPTSTEELRNAPPLFPPVFVGLLATVRSGRWKKIGDVPVTYFAHPKFRQTMGTKPGTYDDWTIWDGLKTIKIGRLPVEYRSLELKCVWGDEDWKRESCRALIAEATALADPLPVTTKVSLCRQPISSKCPRNGFSVTSLFEHAFQSRPWK